MTLLFEHHTKSLQLRLFPLSLYPRSVKSKTRAENLIYQVGLANPPPTIHRNKL